ncbi:hypothetical protein R70723_26010 [Paenibacillus sp. FSL R7-0273]|nr:hypothetical protein R70723_26010 [Paenibacillus sp. FSL R7-0273]OMF90529.1 hypothetical protein BK144_17080 [Paenibacillus sp. FSL R7-0273]
MQITAASGRILRCRPDERRQVQKGDSGATSVSNILRKITALAIPLSEGLTAYSSRSQSFS